MWDADHKNAAFLLPVEHHVLALFHAAQSGPYLIAGTSKRRVVSQTLTTRFELVEIEAGLCRAPLLQRVCADGQQVSLGAP